MHNLAAAAHKHDAGSRDAVQGVSASKVAPQIPNHDSDRREAEDRLKALVLREAALKSSLAHVNSQYEALDLRKELEDMDRKMNDEKAAAMEELNGSIDAEELDPTSEISDRITEVRDKVNRI